MRDDFLEPRRGTNLVGWAVKQVGMWLVGGLVCYAVVVNTPFSRGAAPETGQRTAISQPDTQPSDDSSSAPLQPLGQAVPPRIHTLSFRAQPDGYAYVKAAINDADMVMAFDTGAALVSLTYADAVRAGVVGNLNYTMSFGTANGRGLGAPVTLREIRIGDLVIEDVRAVVMQNMQVSLLGQTFLSRLHSYQMQNGVLTLAWQQ
jgi:aspartyl protease family protein